MTLQYTDPTIPTGEVILSRKYFKVLRDDITFLADAVAALPLHAVAHGTAAAGLAALPLAEGDLLTAQYGRLAFIARPATGTHELEVGTDSIPHWVEV